MGQAKGNSFTGRNGTRSEEWFLTHFVMNLALQSVQISPVWSCRTPSHTDRNVRGIFPHIWRRAQVQSHIWRKYFSPYMTENSLRFSLNMMKISILGENSPQIFPTYDEIIRTRGKIPPDFPKYDKNFYLRGKFPSNFPYIWLKH